MSTDFVGRQRKPDVGLKPLRLLTTSLSPHSVGRQRKPDVGLKPYRYGPHRGHKHRVGRQRKPDVGLKREDMEFAVPIMIGRKAAEARCGLETLREAMRRWSVLEEERTVD